MYRLVRGDDRGREGQEPVSLVATTVKPSPAAERRTVVRARGAQGLILLGYLAAAVVLTWRLWADPAARAQVGDAQDVNLFAWFMRYEATAVAHGRLPALATTAMNPPPGISLMWNTSMLLPGVLLAPVTLLAGPQVTLTVLLTLGFAGSAASLLWVLRRWGASLPAAALGGAVYGFSPALLNSGIGHYNLQFAVLPPLLADALLRLLTGRGGALRAGAWLGLLTVAQLFTGEELLADTALAGLVMTVTLAAAAPRAAAARAGRVLAGLATAGAVTLLLAGPALWAQFRGPLREHYAARFGHHASYLSAHPAVFVTPPGDLLVHTRASAAAAASYPTHLSEYLAYLGWPLLAGLVIAVIWAWPDRRVRVGAVTFAVLELLSLSDQSPFLPSHWMHALPVLSQLIPDRLAILADGAAGAVLAFALDRARAAGARAAVHARPPRLGGRLAGAAAVLAVVPLIPLPLPAAPVPALPGGWHAAFARLRLAPGAPVLVVPIPASTFTEAMRWQADTGEPGSLVGGYFLGPGPGRATRVSPDPATLDAEYLDPLWACRRPVLSRTAAQIRADLRLWHPAAVVEVLRRHSAVRAVLAAILGPPTFHRGRLLVWRLSRGTPAAAARDRAGAGTGPRSTR